MLREYERLDSSFAPIRNKASGRRVDWETEQFGEIEEFQGEAEKNTRQPKFSPPLLPRIDEDFSWDQWACYFMAAQSRRLDFFAGDQRSASGISGKIALLIEKRRRAPSMKSPREARS